jgi:hypothetical protein
MVTVPKWLFVILIFVPFVIAWYLQLRLHRYRRERGGRFLMPSYRALRPDRYTDAGQHLLRQLWLVVILLVPWVLFVAFGFQPR